MKFKCKECEYEFSMNIDTLHYMELHRQYIECPECSCNKISKIVDYEKIMTERKAVQL